MPRMRTARWSSSHAMLTKRGPESPARTGRSPDVLDPEARGLDPSLTEAMQRLDELIDAFETDPDEGIQEMATELLQSIDTVHRAGLVRLAELLGQCDDSIREQARTD